jgi:hypothetical protein
MTARDKTTADQAVAETTIPEESVDHTTAGTTDGTADRTVVPEPEQTERSLDRPGEQPGEQTTDGPLFDEQEAEQFRIRWHELQAGFVDEPGAAVREAESLVSMMMETLTAQLAGQRRELSSEADNQGDTEQLRLTLCRYRVLFDRILSV